MIHKELWYNQYNTKHNMTMDISVWCNAQQPLESIQSNNIVAKYSHIFVLDAFYKTL